MKSSADKVALVALRRADMSQCDMSYLKHLEAIA